MVVVVVVVVAVLVAVRLMIVVVVVAEVLVVVVIVPIPVPVLVQARVLTTNTSRCLLFLVLRLPRQSRLRLLRPLRRLLPVSTFFSVAILPNGILFATLLIVVLLYTAETPGAYQCLFPVAPGAPGLAPGAWALGETKILAS